MLMLAVAGLCEAIMLAVARALCKTLMLAVAGGIVDVGPEDGLGLEFPEDLVDVFFGIVLLCVAALDKIVDCCFALHICQTRQSVHVLEKLDTSFL